MRQLLSHDVAIATQVVFGKPFAHYCVSCHSYFAWGRRDLTYYHVREQELLDAVDGADFEAVLGEAEEEGPNEENQK